MIVLADEVERLGRERELAMVAQPPDLARLSVVDTELARAVAQHSRTAVELARARDETQLATALLAEALTRTRRVRDDVRDLRTAVQMPPGDDDAHMGHQMPPLSDGTASPDAFGDDIDVALDRAEAVGRTIADRLLTALTTLDEEAETLPLSAAPPTDNVDNAVTGGNAADNVPADGALWWDMMAHIPTGTFVWAEEMVTALVRDRDAHDRRLERIARERPARETILLANRLQDHRWLEGAARLRIALALSQAPEVLVPLILALLEAGALLRRAEQGSQLLRAALASRTVEDTLALHNQLIDLVKEVIDVEDGYIGWPMLFALPAPPAIQAELLVRLRATLPSADYFAEMLPSLYGQNADLDDLTEIIVALHTEWSPPRDSAARS